MTRSAGGGQARPLGRGLLTLALAIVIGGAVPLSARPEEGGASTEPAGPYVPLADRIRPELEGGIYPLKVNLHQPERGGHPAPWLNGKGWHRRDIERPVTLAAGEQVLVTGVFGYGDRSIFIELTRWPSNPWGEDPVRARFRLLAESGPEEPGEQEEQIRKLIALVIGRSSYPTP